MEALFLVLVYLLAGNAVANLFWFPRRHGVTGRIGWGLRNWDSGGMGANGIALIWPIALFLPAVRHPPLCRHDHHVLARAEQRQRAAQVDAVRRYENGG